MAKKTKTLEDQIAILISENYKVLQLAKSSPGGVYVCQKKWQEETTFLVEVSFGYSAFSVSVDKREEKQTESLIKNLLKKEGVRVYNSLDEWQTALDG